MAKNGVTGIISILLLIGFIMNCTGSALAHFNFPLPDLWTMETSSENNVKLIWGHPYEGIYFDAPGIDDAKVLKPDGATDDLSPKEIVVDGAEGEVSAYEVSFTPNEKGDHIIYADFEALVVEEEGVAWEDHIKAIIHYKTTEGWDQSTGQIIEIMPLTRPYGLEAGFIFTGQLLYDGKPLGGAPVEIEKYHPVGVVTEENLPDEPMVTRETKTDPNGIFSFTLDEPGLWVLCGSKTVGEMEGYDKDVRAILMVMVEEELSLSGEDGEVVEGVSQQDLEDLEESLGDLEETLNEKDWDLDEKDEELQGEIDDMEDQDLSIMMGPLGLSVIALVMALVALVRTKRK